jgi:tetratricopeptide (TPR) repeat protein
MRLTSILPQILVVLLLCYQTAYPDDAPWTRRLTTQQQSQVDELTQRLNHHLDEDNVADAEEAAKRIIAIRQQHQGSTHWQTGDAGRLLADVKLLASLPLDRRALAREAYEKLSSAARMEADGQGSPGDVLKLLRDGLELTKQAYGQRSLRASLAKVATASQLIELRQYTLAESHLLEALAIWSDAVSEPHPERAGNLQMLGIVCGRQGKWPEAERYLLQATEIYEQVYGPTHTEMIDVLAALSNMQWQQGKPAEAVASLERAVTTAQAVVGDAHFTCDGYQRLGALHKQGSRATRFDAIGQIYVNDAPLEKAAAAYRTAYEMRLRIAPDDHQRLYMDAWYVGDCLVSNGRAAFPQGVRDTSTARTRIAKHGLRLRQSG